MGPSAHVILAGLQVLANQTSSLFLPLTALFQGDVNKANEASCVVKGSSGDGVSLTAEKSGISSLALSQNFTVVTICTTFRDMKWNSALCLQSVGKIDGANA